MLVTHVVAELRRELGGPSYSVPALAGGLRLLGVQAHVRYVGEACAEDAALATVAAPPTKLLGALGRRLCLSPSLAQALRDDALAGTVLHAHGLWLAPNLYPAWAKRRTAGGAKLVHSPRGMLAQAALAISPWKKKAMWLLVQRAALCAADCLHATAGSELEEIRAMGLTTPVTIIPNGVDLPEIGGAPRRHSDDCVILSLGRIHPKKGLDRLVRAWATLEDEFPSWRLRIVGPAELGHDEELRSLAGAVGARRVSVEGPLYDEAKLALLRSANVFVLPTLNENFGLTVSEALAAEVPVISTKGAPWAGLESERCGWWIEHGVEPMCAALRAAMLTPFEERAAMGIRGRNWMARDFGWGRVAREMLAVYRWLRDGGDAPATVNFV